MTHTTYSIEFVHKNWWLCQRGIYERSSVLAGEDFRQLCKPYKSLDEAKADNPGVKVSDEDAPVPAELSINAPNWFDPSDAGESWGEDDY